ncbi:MAG: hypothetical protein KatS3mg014_2530 [Actinomycetota bacterium]|nr:MAG: hypothetical protein KatS3mg014_2475 [Actinomycetota bacterium]GIV00915.1 MAG: hypothetical protein KatS3mg014_2530 [Actinomycetota bacterium]
MTVEELRSALDEAVERFRELRAAQAPLHELRPVAEQIATLRRELEAASLVEDVAASLEEPEVTEDVVEATGEVAEEVAEEAPEASPQAEASPRAEVVAASAPVARVASRVPNGLRRTSIVAAADVPGFSAGMPIPDLEELGRAFADKADAMRRGGSGRALVASFRWEISEMLSHGDARHNESLIAAAVERKESELRSLVAAGGFCAPAETLYDIPSIHTAERPLLGALPTVGAPRGRIRYVRPHALSEATAGIQVRPASSDTTGNPKPVVRISCPTEVTAEVQAIPLRAVIGNFDRMTFPEHFENFWSTALAQLARTCERALLDAIDANCTQVTDGRNLGAARDLLEALGRHVAARRDDFRMPVGSPVVVVMRSWVLDMIRADLAREAPGSAQERLAVSDAEIARFFAVRNIVPVFTLEGRTNGGQDFAAQGTGASLPWPSTVEAHIFWPGAFTVLTLPQLDLGVEIRDSALNATNDVEAFLEVFEGVAWRGLWATRLRMNVCVTGEAAALATVACTGS